MGEGRFNIYIFTDRKWENDILFEYIVRICSYISSIFNVYDGNLYLNRLSVYQVEYLLNYYKNVIEQFDERGEYSFIERQLSWLGIEQEKIKGIISIHKKGELETSKDSVINQFQRFANQGMTEEEVAKMKDEIKKELLTLIKNVPEDTEGWKATYDMANKKGRNISKNNMEFLRKYCGIPYQIEHEYGKKEYVLKKCTKK